ERRRNFLGGRIERCPIEHVAGEALGHASLSLDLLRELLRLGAVSANDGHLGAASCQRLTHRRAEDAAASGNDGDLVLQIHSKRERGHDPVLSVSRLLLVPPASLRCSAVGTNLVIASQMPLRYTAPRARS